MGYLWTRTATAKSEHFFDAVGIGHKITAYVGKRHPEFGVKLYIQVMGQTNRVVFTATFDSVDDFNGKMAAMLADPEYVGMIKAAGPMWVPGSGQDTLLMEAHRPG